VIPELGTGLVLASLFFASFGAVLGFWSGAKRHMAAWTWARRSAYGFAFSMLGANFLMVYALLSHDFTVKYVQEVGSRATPVYFTIVSLWASLNGSILFWGGILAVYVLGFLWANGKRHREYMPYTIGMLLANSVFFAILVSSIANPFARMPIIPDGPGPNPLLQNHWLMAVHPPTLYLGYVGMVVPYSMICAAMFAGRLDAGWLVPLRRWMMIPWTFLTVGIVLGGWWSYGVLGWGGAWAWDPVENASFHPWLTGTAFIHSAMVLQRRGDLRIWTLVLGMATFLLTLVGTFMTRSGVFNSVHSFTQSNIGPVFLVFIAIVLVFSVILLAVREHTLAIDEEAEGANTTLISSVFGHSMHPLGREFTILLQNAVFTVFTFTVLLGTLYPLIAEVVEERKVSVGEPYFDRWALPLGLMLVFLMGVGPALPWGRMSPSRVPTKLGPPVIAGAVVSGAFALSGFYGPLMCTATFLVGFAFWGNAAEFLTPLRIRMTKRGEGLGEAAVNVFRRTRRRFGGHVAHYGVLLAVLALALMKGYKEEVDVTLKPGQTAELGHYAATFVDSRIDKQEHRTSVAAVFSVRDGSTEAGEYLPKLNYYPSQREPIFTPAVHSTLTGDFYLSVVELDPDGAYVVVRMITMPGVVWLWIAPVLMALGSIIAMWPASTTPRRATAPTGGEQRA
jgi:cytochrome c-type biogenesis protein CcmF